MSETAEDMNVSNKEKKYPLVKIRGLPLFKTFLTESAMEEVMDFKPCDSDVFIVTYPKCGATWAQYLVWEIMHKGAPPPSPNQMMSQHIPFLEYTGLEAVKKLSHPRVMKTHLPFSLQPYNPLTKYIYIVRNPWDCCVSYYHHIQMMGSSLPKLSFDEHFNLFISGEISWGNYFDHVLSWSKHRDDSNVLFITYEGLKKDTRSWLLKIAKFLGNSYYENIQSEDVIENCLRHSDFEYLKQMGMFFVKPENLEPGTEIIDAMKLIGGLDRNKASGMKCEELPFFRKGIIGDWKNHFTPEQIEIFNEHMTQKLKNTNMEHFWSRLIGETAL